MSVNLLCADIPYADIAFFVIIALGLILGIIRGFAKSFKGFFLTIAIMLAALLLIAPTFDKVRNLDVFVNMDNSISAKFESGNVIFSTPINVRVDAETGEKSYWVSVTTDDGTSEQPLESSMGNDLTSSLKGKFAVWLAKTFITDDGQTIGGVAGTFVSDIIVAVVCSSCIVWHCGSCAGFFARYLQKCTRQIQRLSLRWIALSAQSYP